MCIQALLDYYIKKSIAIGLAVGVIDHGKIDYYFSGTNSLK